MKKIILLSLLIGATFFFSDKTTSAFGECSQYGYMASYDYLSNSCTCSTGYSFGKDLFGKTSCVSNDQLCKDQYGSSATSDYFTGNCKCNYGYGFGKNSLGKTQCISLDSMCYDQLGYSSSYDSISDSCKCRSGYIIQNGRCVDGDNFCRAKQGLYSSYDSSAKQCSCDSGYTLGEDGQCAKKQNNVYFTLKELDTDNKKAIIKSDYDYRYYSIKYNSGCYASSFKRYLNHQIVVNLGTDFDLDTWDKIVLQDDNETCDITSREKVDAAFSLKAADDALNLALYQLITANEVAQKNIPTQSGLKFLRNLQVGSSGADVTGLQIKLGISPATSYFGPATKKAVIKYQKDNNIYPASGYVGALTRAILNSDTNTQ